MLQRALKLNIELNMVTCNIRIRFSAEGCRNWSTGGYICGKTLRRMLDFRLYKYLHSQIIGTSTTVTPVAKYCTYK